jgi:hypothetical protein
VKCSYVHIYNPTNSYIFMNKIDQGMEVGEHITWKQ